MLTDAQRCLLECIRDHADADGGWAEVQLQFSALRGLPEYLEASTLVRVCKALERKGLITADDSLELTDAARALLGAT